MHNFVISCRDVQTGKCANALIDHQVWSSRPRWGGHECKQGMWGLDEYNRTTVNQQVKNATTGELSRWATENTAGQDKMSEASRPTGE